MKRTTTAIACSAAALALGLSGCGASFEGSGSKDAASAEQLALTPTIPGQPRLRPMRGRGPKATTPTGCMSGTGAAWRAPSR